MLESLTHYLLIVNIYLAAEVNGESANELVPHCLLLWVTLTNAVDEDLWWLIGVLKNSELCRLDVMNDFFKAFLEVNEMDGESCLSDNSPWEGVHAFEVELLVEEHSLLLEAMVNFSLVDGKLVLTLLHLGEVLAKGLLANTLLADDKDVDD